MELIFWFGLCLLLLLIGYLISRALTFSISFLVGLVLAVSASFLLYFFLLLFPFRCFDVCQPIKIERILAASLAIFVLILIGGFIGKKQKRTLKD